MRRFTWVVVPLLLGCSRTADVSIRMRTEGAGLERSLSSRGDDGLLAAIRGAVSEAYGAEDPDRATAVFVADLPGEFGGSGFQRGFESELGRAWVYSERLQPARSLSATVSEVSATCERACDLYAGWLRWELDELPQFERALDEIGPELRGRSKDLALLLALPFAAGPSPQDENLRGWPLVAHELLELGFVSLEELPALERLTDQDDSEVAAWFLARLRRLLATELEVAADDPAFGFLRDGASLVASWRAWIAAGGGRDVPEPPAADSDPSEALEPLMHGLNLIELWADRTRVEVSLGTGVEPLLTNGEFDPVSGEVRWPQAEIESRTYQPLYRYAYWAVPDEEAQYACFGRVALERERLFEYALWRAGLEPWEAAEWNRCLASLAGSESPAFELERFRFPAAHQLPPDLEPADEHQGPPRGAQLVIQALKAD
ncbi:MAG: hypothetical protein EXS08_16165 [Planctomycetes bacterium]|nr:hypothetical protein [Planctomycetota bacterium]